MKRPSFVQALAIINSILVIVMMVEIYRLKNPKPKPQVQFQDAPSTDVIEPPNTDDLFVTITAPSTFKEKIEAINNLQQLNPGEQEALFVWATEALPQANEHNRLEILNLSDAAYRKLIATGYEPPELASFFEQAVDDQSFWMPQKQQALIGMFLLFEQVSKLATDEDKKVVESSLKRVTESTLQDDNASLAVTALDGGLYLEPRISENPIRDQLDEYCFAILQKDNPRTITLKAIDYATTRGLDISSQAARLIKNSQDATVAIAAQKYLLNFHNPQTGTMESH